MQNRKLLPLLLPLIFLSLIAAVWAGWIRIGWQFPLSVVAGKHGALMVGSFLGTLISLERAVVIKSIWAMLVPLFSGISFVFFALDMEFWAFITLCLGSVGQAIMMAWFLDKYKELYFGIMFFGSASWFMGNLMWLKYGLYPAAAPWWIAFLLLIITAERLELTRYLPIKQRDKIVLLVFLGLVLIGVIMPFHGNGRYLTAVGMILTGAWLLKFDMARKAVKKTGQHRFSALLLLCGYVWLIISGIMMLIGDMYGFIYDAVLHAFFVGFVFSMIFAHGPVILPGVLGVAIKPYHQILYVPAILLEVSLLLRIIGDLISMVELRSWGGMLNGIAILLFFVLMAALIIKEKRKFAVSLKANRREGKVI